MRWLQRLRPDRDPRRIPLAEPLEPRLLYSADLGVALQLVPVVAPADTATPDVRTLTSTGEYVARSTANAQAAGETAQVAAAGTQAAAASSYLSSALAFAADSGSDANGADFTAYGSGYGIALHDAQASLTLVTAEGTRNITLQLPGATSAPQGEGEGMLATRSNVIVGNDPSKWATDVANYGSVVYRGVYDGVDVRYYGNQRQLEYDFIVAAGADAGQVALRFDGVSGATVADNGDLVLQVANSTGEVRFRAPVAYQRGADGSMEAVASGYQVHADGSIGFVLGDYDHSRELVIDPVLDYASYFGTSGNEDAPAVAVDASGNVYITGRTNSNAAPVSGTVTSGSGSGGGGGGGDIYVAKFSPDLSTLLFSTRIGGSGDEQGNAIAVDASGSIVITGKSTSNDFPTQSANDATRSGGGDAVLVKLNASGSLVFSTYIGGTGGSDEGNGVAVDASGNIYVTGQTTSSGLLDPILALLLGSSDNAFVEKYSSSGSLVYHKELGGGNVDLGTGIAVGPNGDVFVVGNTQSNNMSVTGGEQSALRGSIDGFLAHLDASGNTLYQTYIGGTDADTTTAVATDGTGKAYVVGVTRARASVVFTTTAGAFETTTSVNNANTGFLRVYDTTKTGSASLQYSTYIGGSNTDLPSGVALTGANVLVVGKASSTTDFPVTSDAVQSTNAGGAMYLVMINPAGSGAADLRYGTFFASGFVTTGNVVVQSNRVYTSGQIADPNWATTGAYDTARQGNDAFVAVFTLPNNAPVLTGVVQPPAIAEDSVGNSGFLVSALVAAKISDTDPGALPGIAVVASDTSHGSWEYSLDGSTWQGVSSVSAANALLLAADATTRVRFVPATDYNGTVTAGLTVRAWDRTSGMAGSRADAGTTGGSTAFSTASFGVNVTVTPVNDAPVVSGTVTLAAIAEDSGTLTITKAQLLQNASDVDGDTLSVLNVAASTGTLVANGNGTWSFTPGANFNGPVTFTYLVSDGTATMGDGADLTVTPVNDAPVAAADNIVATRNQPITIAAATLLGNDSDVEGNALTIASVASGSRGTAVLNADGSVTFTPEPNYSGPATFSYTASDGALQSAPATVSVTVNTLPVAAADSVTATEDTPATYGAATLLANDSDADVGDALTLASVASGTGGTAVLNANGSVTFTPTANFNGTGSFTYTVTDGKGVSAPATVTVTVAAVNDPPVANADSFTVAEDNALSINLPALLTNDTDVEGSTLSVVSVADGTGGTVVLNGNGTVKFTPATDFNGTATFTYVVSDGTANSLPATVTITVTPVNDAPVANDDTGGTDEDTPLTFTAAQLLGNDTDAEGNPLTIASVSAGAVLNADGSVTFTPPTNFNGTTSFSYRASDGTDLSGNAKVTVTVRPVNDAPVAAADNLAAVSDTPITYAPAQLLGNDSDVDGGPLRVGSVTSGAGGTAVLNADGSVTFTPTAGFAGNAGFTYTASDGSLDSAPAAVTVRVNDVPAAHDDTVSATEDTPATYAAGALLGNDTDTVGSPLRIAGVGNAAGGTVVLNGNGSVSFTPLANYNGSGSFTYTVTDGSLVSAPATVTVNVAAVNDAPTNSGPVTLPGMAEDGGPVLITQGQLLQNAADVDGDALAVANLVASTGSLVSNGNGTWTFTPALDFNGSVGFTYSVTDGALSVAGSASLGVTPVNDAPATTPVTLAPMAEDSGTVVITSADLLQHASDVEHDTLALLNVAANSGTLVANADGTWNYTPAANFHGTVDFTYTVSDGTAGTPGTATLTVTPVNDAPTTSAVALPPMAEDSGTVTITKGQLLASAADVDGDTLSVVNLVANTGTLAANADGTWSFTPGANFNGTVGFTYGVSDGTAMVAGSATLGVSPVNDAPTASGPVSLPAMAEDSGSVVITASDLLQNASDVDLDALSITNLVASTGTLVANGNGTWSFTPGGNYNGTVGFTYSVSDGTTTTGTSATLVVTPVNDAPTTTAVTLASIAEDSGPMTIAAADLLAGAVDIDGDVLSVGNVVADTGTLLANGNATWTFTPDANYNGPVHFRYAISDGAASLAGSANLDVTPVNDAPANSGTVSLAPVAEDSGTVVITAADLLQNASDVENDALSVLNLVAGSGTLVANANGTWSYTPAANFNGTVNFTYSVGDGTANTPAAATLTVAPVNDAPANSGAVTLPTIAEDSGASTLTRNQLLQNASDVDGDTLSVVNLVASTGTLVANADGTWSFTPPADFHGGVTFTYGIGDGTVATPGSATLAVTAVNDAPANSGPVNLPAVAEDSGTVTITASDLLQNASDVDGDSLSVTSLVASTGTLVANGSGTWSFTPGANYNGTVSFTYSISDGSASTAGNASLVVKPVNDAPTTPPVTLPAIAEDTSLTISASDLLAGASDVDHDVLGVSNVVASTGTLVANGNGTWTFTPPGNYNGPVNFGYTVSDGTASVAGSASLDVTSVNDAPTNSGTVSLPAMAEDSGTLTIKGADLLANAADVDGDALTVINLAASAGTLVANGNGTWSFTPAPNYNGTVNFTYAISDGTATAAGAASLVVTPVNDAPTTTAVTLASIAEDSGPLTITAADLLANAADVDGDLLAVGNVVASTGTLVANGNATWTFTPTANDNGTVTFNYTIGDGTVSVAGSADVTVTPVNDAPTSSGTVSLPAMAEDSGTLTIKGADLLANAADIDGDALTVSNVVASTGTLTSNGNGTWSYTPAGNYNGSVNFTYSIGDGAATTGGTASLVVTPVNDAPADSGPVTLAAILQDTGGTITPADLLRNASDVDGDALGVGTLSASVGTLVANADGTWSYTPATGYAGPVSFTYTVSDGALSTAGSASLTVTAAAAPAPVAPVSAPAPSAAPAPAPVATAPDPGIPPPAPAASAPNPAPAPAPAASAPPAAPTAAPAPAVTPLSTTDARGPRTSETLQEALGPTMATPIATFNNTEVSFATAPARLALDADTSREFRTVVFDRGGIELISTQPDAQLVLGRFGIVSRPESGRVEDLQRTLRSTAFAGQLDRMRESVREELDLDQNFTISVVSVSLGLSLMYVLWLIRGGVLLGSYLSALPAWRMLDPLPVLSRVEEEQDEEEPLGGADPGGRDTLRGFG